MIITSNSLSDAPRWAIVARCQILKANRPVSNFRLGGCEIRVLLIPRLINMLTVRVYVVLCSSVLGFRGGVYTNCIELSTLGFLHLSNLSDNHIR